MATYDNREYISHGYETRQKELNFIVTPNNNSTFHLRSINYLEPKIFNKLPQEFKSGNGKVFKSTKKKISQFIYRNYVPVFTELFGT